MFINMSEAIEADWILLGYNYISSSEEIRNAMHRVVTFSRRFSFSSQSGCFDQSGWFTLTTILLHFMIYLMIYNRIIYLLIMINPFEYSLLIILGLCLGVCFGHQRPHATNNGSHLRFKEVPRGNVQPLQFGRLESPTCLGMVSQVSN